MSALDNFVSTADFEAGAARTLTKNQRAFDLLHGEIDFTMALALCTSVGSAIRALFRRDRPPLA